MLGGGVLSLVLHDCEYKEMEDSYLMIVKDDVSVYFMFLRGDGGF